MLTFDNDEAGYLQWIEKNSTGYVINTPKRSGDFPDMLHRANCRHISRGTYTNYTTTDFKKLCSLNKQEMLAWGQVSSPDFRMCKVCNP